MYTSASRDCTATTHSHHRTLHAVAPQLTSHSLNSDSTASSHPLLHTHPFFQAPTLSEFSIFGLPLVTSCELFIPFKPSSVCNPLITFPVPDSRHTQHLTLYQQHSPHSPGRLNTFPHIRNLNIHTDRAHGQLFASPPCICTSTHARRHLPPAPFAWPGRLPLPQLARRGCLEVVAKYDQAEERDRERCQT